MTKPIVIQRSAARRAGLVHYYTGRPCHAGHDQPRFVRTGICVKCNREYQTDWASRHPVAKKEQNQKDRRAYYARHREACLARSKAYYAGHRAERCTYTRAYYERNRDQLIPKGTERKRLWRERKKLEKQKND
jgi:hypothetical protein